MTDAGDAGAVTDADRAVRAIRTTLWAEVEPLAERFAAAGHRLYLVGGTVRDLIAGADRPVFDLDATTTARPAEIKRLLHGWADAVWTQGERFGTIGALKHPATEPGAGGHSEPRVFEITTHRAEAYTDGSRKPAVVFSDDVVADLSRRDFTVNAMAVEITTETPVLVDPFGGATDLGARVLRTPLTPAESFSDDPLRMLRAARFVTRYRLEPVPELMAAVRSMGARLGIVSAERIRDELDKLLVTDEPAAGLRFLVDTGLLAHALPAVAALAGLPSRRSPGRGRDGRDALGSSLAAVAAAGPMPAGWTGSDAEVRLVRWAALLDELDADAAGEVLRSLRSSGADVATIASMVAVQQRWFDPAPVDPGPDERGADAPPRDDPAEPWTDPDVRRFVRAARSHLASSVALALAHGAPVADPGGASRHGDVRALGRVTELVAALTRLGASEDLDDLGPVLDGAAVMALLGVPPGRDVGLALDHLTEARLEHGPLSPEQAIEILQSWWTDHAE